MLAHSVAEPSLTAGLVTGDAGAIDRFDREVLDRLLVGDVQRIKIWTGDGTIVYSDQTRADRRAVRAGRGRARDPREGGTEAEVSDLSEPENRFETARPAWSRSTPGSWRPTATPLLFEAYYSTADIEADTQQVFGPFRRIMLGSLLVLGALATLMIWGSRGGCTGPRDERQRLLQAAIDASDAERRRIARDLHDGVVQDLAGTAFALSAAAREPRAGRARDRRPTRPASLRGSLRALRSLLVEIHPPDLDADGLAAALDDLVAPAAAAGMTAHVERRRRRRARPTGRSRWSGGSPRRRSATRCGTRVAPGSTSQVERRRRPGRRWWCATTGSASTGRSATDGEHLGLRGLAGLVARRGRPAGRRLRPGRGTTVTLEVDAMTAAAEIRVVVVDDHAVVRAGLAQLLVRRRRHRGGRRRPAGATRRWRWSRESGPTWS